MPERVTWIVVSVSPFWSNFIFYLIFIRWDWSKRCASMRQSKRKIFSKKDVKKWWFAPDLDRVFWFLAPYFGSSSSLFHDELCPFLVPISMISCPFMNQGVANINFWYERIFEYIHIQKTIRTNIWLNKYDTNEYLYRKIFEYLNIRHTQITIIIMICVAKAQ